MSSMIKTEQQYEAALQRIDELLLLVNDQTPTSDKNFIELDLLSGLVEAYEEVHYPIATPSLIDVLKLRMYERNLTQKGLSDLLGVSTSRISEYLSGKSEPSLKIARSIHNKLQVDSDVIIGVA